MPSVGQTKKGASRGSLSKLIEKVDRSDLKSDFDEWPELAKDAWTNSNVEEVDQRVDSIVFTGMGGSGIIGALLCDYANETRSPRRFECLNDYHLRSNLSKNTLVVGVSCSGNTEETLSALSEAHSKGLMIASFGSGGRIKDFSEKWHSKFTQTKMLKTPRSSLPGLLFAVLKFFWSNRLLQIEEAEVAETIENMKKVRNLCRGKDELENPSLAIARRIIASNAPLLIYSNSRTHGVGLRFRQSVNENAKLHAFHGDVPEICHNDVVGWDYSKADLKNPKSKMTPLAIMLRFEDDFTEIKTRFRILQDIIRKRGGKSLDSPCVGKSYLSRTLSMLYLLDYTTYYAAILRGVDPMKTPSIDLLKRELNKKLNFLSRVGE